MTKEELAAKVEWEGGVAEAITGYGLKFDELPDNAPLAVTAAWARLYYQGREDIRTIQDWLEGNDSEGGAREPSGDRPDSPAPGEARLPGGSDDYLTVGYNPDNPRDLWANITPLSPEEFMARRMRSQEILDIPWNSKAQA